VIAEWLNLQFADPAPSLTLTIALTLTLTLNVAWQVYFPGSHYSQRLRSLDSFHRLRHALEELEQHRRSWWSAFKARSSWLLHPTEACRPPYQLSG